MFLTKMKLNALKKRAQVLHDKRARGEQISAADEIKAFLDLAQFYDKHANDKHYPFAKIEALEYYRAAGHSGSSEAQYIFAQRKLELAKFWQKWAEGPLSMDIHQKIAKQCFEDAFQYLISAENHGYPLAKRLHGLAYIHGWGVTQDKDKGFQLIVASIEEEKAWDRATTIFAELGLNSPEFFSSIMAAKNKNNK
ncbi:MAG: hypothetical protein AB7F64_06705 [Gammaproteobacteria bacterium]